MFAPSLSSCLVFNQNLFKTFRRGGRVVILNAMGKTKAGTAQWYSAGREIERSRVRIPEKAAGEFSSSGSTFCADPYFGIRSSEPVRPNGNALGW